VGLTACRVHDQKVRAHCAGYGQGLLASVFGLALLICVMNRNSQLASQRLELVNSRGPVNVGRDEIGIPALFPEVKCQLAGGCRFP